MHSKRVLTAGIDGLLDALGVVVDGRLEPVTVELPADAHRADLLFWAPSGLVVHVEVQQAPDPDMGRRMVEYAARIARLARAAPGAVIGTAVTDLAQVVFQVTGPPMPATYRIGGLTNEVLLVHVPTAPAEWFLTVPSLAPFALVGSGQAAVPQVVDAITRQEDVGVGAAMTALAVDLAEGFRDTVLAALRRSVMIHPVEEIVAELRDTEFGREMRAEGRVEGRREAVAEILRSRFPGADRDRVAGTARRLCADSENPVAAALALPGLDASPS